MAARVGNEGRIIAFEPHPEIFSELDANVKSWKQEKPSATVELHQAVLSDRSGTANLQMGEEFLHNRGTAVLDAAADSDSSETRGIGSCRVALRQLDDVLDSDANGITFALAKIDVEGHELSVLSGATRTLQAHRIRHVLFEDYNVPPTPACRLLEASGYSIARVQSDFWGLRVLPVAESADNNLSGPPSYIATVDPAHLTVCFERKGWLTLKNSA